jgi:hypothetical protein
MTLGSIFTVTSSKRKVKDRWRCFFYFLKSFSHLIEFTWFTAILRAEGQIFSLFSSNQMPSPPPHTQFTGEIASPSSDFGGGEQG